MAWTVQQEGIISLYEKEKLTQEENKAKPNMFRYCCWQSYNYKCGTKIQTCTLLLIDNQRQRCQKMRSGSFDLEFYVMVLPSNESKLRIYQIPFKLFWFSWYLESSWKWIVDHSWKATSTHKVILVRLMAQPIYLGYIFLAIIVLCQAWNLSFLREPALLGLGPSTW